MNFKLITYILTFILLAVMVAGCTAEPPAKKVEEKVDYKLIVCPNPECDYHIPQANLDYYRGIDMELSPSRNEVYYLCQYCGARWQEDVIF